MNGNRNDHLLRTFTFSFFMTTAIIVSYFPLYFESRGYSAIQIGLLYSVGPMLGIASNLFWGLLSDKLQTVKKLLVVILLGQLAFAFLMFRTDSFGVLMALMACFYFFQTPTSALNDSLTLLTVSGTGKSYASFRVFGSLGFAFASLLFGMYLKSKGSGLTPALSLSTISLALLLSMLLKDARGSVKKMQFGGLVRILMSRRFALFMLLVLTISVAHRANDSFLALFMRKLGADQTLIGWSWAISAVSEIPIFFFLSKFGHRYKELPLLVLASGVYAVRFLFVSLTDNPIWIIPIQMMHSISFGIYMFTVIRCIQQMIPDEYRSTGQAIYAVTWSGLAGLISGSAGGWIFQKYGPHAVYGTAAALAVVAMIGFWLMHVSEQRSGQADAGS